VLFRSPCDLSLFARIAAVAQVHYFFSQLIAHRPLMEFLTRLVDTAVYRWEHNLRAATTRRA
jgi:ABC-type phosphate/phosphonate transport system permease subunit